MEDKREHMNITNTKKIVKEKKEKTNSTKLSNLFGDP